MVIVYTRPTLCEARSARRSSVSGPVKSQSPPVLPSPVVFVGSLLVTEYKVEVKVPDAVTVMVTEIISWLGGHSTLGLATTLMILAGGVTTITLKEHVFVLPELSTATHNTLFVPFGNNDPEAGVLAGVRFPSQLSVAPTLKLTTAPAVPVVLVTTMSCGHVMAGACLSKTTTRNEQVFVFPAESLATHVTTLVPFGNSVPEGGVQMTGTGPLLSSTAVG
jgi:hypothetical protein